MIPVWSCPFCMHHQAYFYDKDGNYPKDVFDIRELISRVVSRINNQAASVTESTAAVNETISSINNLNTLSEAKKELISSLDNLAKTGKENMGKTLISIKNKAEKDNDYTNRLISFYKELENFYHKIEYHLVKILEKLLEEKDPEIRAQRLISLGTAGRFCGTRLTDAAKLYFDIYFPVEKEKSIENWKDKIYQYFHDFRSDLLNKYGEGRI